MGRILRKIQRAIGVIDEVETPSDDAALLDRIRKNVALDAEATRKQRELELDDLRFCDPQGQWSEDDRRAREQAGRPCLTEDRLGPFLMQVCNEQRKNKPGVQVNPVDDSGDPETAEVIQGLIRHIEYNSNADTAYDTAFEWAVRCGRGFYRICTDYSDQEGFDQEILIKRIPNPQMVFVDPAAQEADFSDMKWGGVKAWMSREDFKSEYPNSQLSTANTSAWQAIGDDAEDWMSKDGGACMVVEYFEKEFTRKSIEKDGRKREVVDVKVKWYKCTAVEILERGEFASKHIPIVAVLGKEIIVDGERTWAGLIRSGKDPQKRHNYLLTSQVERIAFHPIATWIGAKGFMGKEKKLWANAHKQPIAALEFEIIGDEGQGINAPRLITEEASIRNVTEAIIGAEQGMKAVLGMYDPSLGNREGSQSGVAIGRLQAQGETGNFHFQDNLSRAIRYEGRILLDLIPTVYDTERVVRIIGEDGTQKQVRVNAPLRAQEEAAVRDGIRSMYDLTTGKYDVTISTGPSYQSKRQEDRALLLGMLNGPMGELIAQRAGDLLAKTLDSPIAKDLAERLTPPDIAQKNQQGQAPIPPQVQQQLQQSGQMIEQLTAKVHELADQLDSDTRKIQADMAKAQLDADTKLRIARMNNETELLKVEAQITAGGALPEIKGQLAELQELVLAHHGVIAPQPEQEEEPNAPAQAGAETPQPLANAGMEQA